MEIIVGLAIIGLIVARSIRKKRAKEQFNNLPEKEKQRILKEEQKKKRQADELITVILPTNKNDN